MKIAIVKYSIIIIILAVNACDKKDTTLVLPPETQEGRTTFGCLINNKVYTNVSSFKYGAGFYLVNDMNNVSLVTLMHIPNQNISQEMVIALQKPIKVGIYSINSSSNQASYINGFEKPLGCYYSTDTIKNVGTVEISKYDTIQKILAGRFHFSVHKIYNITMTGDTIKGTCDSILYITQGRFDLRY